MNQWFLLLVAIAYSQAVPTPLNSNNLNSILPEDQLANSTRAPRKQPPKKTGSSKRLPVNGAKPPAHSNVLKNGTVQVNSKPRSSDNSSTSISNFKQRRNESFTTINNTSSNKSSDAKSSGLNVLGLNVFKMLLIFVLL